MVNVTWSLINNGPQVPSFIDHGDISNGQTTTPVTLYLRHDGINPITNVGLYVREFSGTYSGSLSGTDDLLEIRSWGDGVTALTFGGFQFSFNSSTWPSSYTSKDTPTTAYTYRTGVGDSELKAITLDSTATGGSSGVIAAGNTTTHFQVRIQVPSSVDIVGTRQWDLTTVFTYTT